MSRGTGQIGLPLRAVREARGMTLADAAIRAEVDESYLSRIERGQRLPSLRLLARLAEVYGAEQLARQLEPYVSGVDD